MDVQYSKADIDESLVISRKAWTAYIMPTVVTAIFVALIFIFGWKRNPMYSAAGIWVISMGYGYIFALTRSYKLYLDDSGVWIFFGLMPWKRGSFGVKWRDLDEAIYYTGFMSWFFGSYTISITHRFTRESEIHLTHMYNGNKAVEKVNSYLQIKLAENPN